VNHERHAEHVIAANLTLPAALVVGKRDRLGPRRRVVVGLVDVAHRRADAQPAPGQAAVTFADDDGRHSVVDPDDCDALVRQPAHRPVHKVLVRYARGVRSEHVVEIRRPGGLGFGEAQRTVCELQPVDDSLIGVANLDPEQALRRRLRRGGGEVRRQDGRQGDQCEQ
jgi:hypothetical protein